MLRKIVFQVHWLIGITLGTVLAMSGVTGGLMAFDKEISGLLLHQNQLLPQCGSRPLSTAAIYERIHTDNPARVIASLTPGVDTRHATLVEFVPAEVIARGAQNINSDDDRNEMRLADPCTGALMPRSSLSQREQTFMAWLRQVHQGHWLPPDNPIGQIVYKSVGIAALLLFVMALSGLYMRWPRGRAARQWRSWFKIHTQLKGRAFLWNLHSVLGTVVLLAYLISAHSGAFQNSTVSWYNRGVRALFNLPQPGSPEGPPARGRQSVAAFDDSKFWRAFIAVVPAFESAKIFISRAPDLAQVEYAPVDQRSGKAGLVRIDATTGAVIHTPPADMPALSIGEKLVANNQVIHEGRIFGKPGVAVMMLASLAMPAFYITGWMMYLKRRKRRVVPPVTARSTGAAIN